MFDSVWGKSSRPCILRGEKKDASLNKTRTNIPWGDCGAWRSKFWAARLHFLLLALSSGFIFLLFSSAGEGPPSAPRSSALGKTFTSSTSATTFVRNTPVKCGWHRKHLVLHKIAAPTYNTVCSHFFFLQICLLLHRSSEFWGRDGRAAPMIGKKVTVHQGEAGG